MFVDFCCKAFDCDYHRILIPKLENIKLEHRALSILSSFLHERTQFVRFAGEVSYLLNITIGVPHRSILAPVLFQIYI